MAFFKKREEKSTDKLEVEKVKIATTTILSSYNDGTGAGPQCVKWYFLVHEVNGKYYEIFSNKQMEKKSDTNHDGFTIKSFDTPYIEKLEPITDYLKDTTKKVIEKQLLFDFILNMNILERLGAFEENND